MSFSVLLGKMLIFVVLMVIGYLCVRTGYISKAFVADASKITLNVFLVASIINSVISSDMKYSFAEIAKITGIMSLALIICYVLAFIAAKLTKLTEDRKSVYEILVANGNSMFIALPVAQQVYGILGVFYVSMSCLPINVMFYSYCVYRLSKGQDGVKLDLKKFFSTPLVATVVSLVIFLLKIPVPGIIKNVISTMSSATMPLSMLVVGASLGGISFSETFKDKDVYLTGILRLFIVPVIVYFILTLIPMDPVLLKSAVLISASPCAIVCTVLAIQYHRDYVFASKSILLTTTISMLTIPLWVYFLG